MKISLYTFVRNGIQLDFHVEAMLRHHVDLVDEIIVNEGYSDDGTYEKISSISPKIKVIRSEWDRSDMTKWYIRFKERARAECTGDWCLLVDCDEFVPEWEFAGLRKSLAATDYDILPMRYINFYGNYRVYHARPEKHKWPIVKWSVHRNLPDLEIWGDGSNIRSTKGIPPAPAERAVCECHHFGVVRHAARLRQKWRTQARELQSEKPRPNWMPKLAFDFFPHDWFDPDFLGDLEIYDGSVINSVLADPSEFVRDNMRLYEHLRSRAIEPDPTPTANAK